MSTTSTTTHDAARTPGTEPQMTTTATAPDAPVAITLPRGVIRAVRLHMVTLLRSLSWPWAILGISFAVNLVLAAAGAFDNSEGAVTGGLASLYIVVMVAYLQAMTQLFSFALGMGVSRRSFFLGTVAFAIAQSVFYGALIYLLSVIETATHGWGVHLPFFRVRWLTSQDSPLALLAIYIVPLLAMACLAMFLGIMHKRWGTNGLLTLTAAATVLFSGIAALVTWRDGWAAVGDWLTEQSPLSLAAGWPWALIAGCLAGAWLIIRRTTP
jgi:hypothetical protein